MNLKIIIFCISFITLNEMISVYIYHIYYIRLLLIINIWLLLDIFRIYNDYLLVLNELKINKNNNIISEEIRYNNIQVSTLITKITFIEHKLEYIKTKLLHSNLYKNTL
jgi:hypothetical protein